MGIVLAQTQGAVITDFDEILPTGFYYVQGGSLNRPIHGAVYAAVINRSYDCVTVFTEDSDGGLARRRYNGSWGVWEYINPPMNLGVEYRTTERYLGKPVYVKAIDFGALPNATQKIVQYGDDTTRTIRACAVDNHGEIISGGTGYVQNFTQWLAMSTDNNKVGISCAGDATDRTGCIVTVWYYKTTD